MPDFFKQVGAARFGVMAGVAAVLTAFFLYVAGVVGEPPKSILFSGLESREAAAVTAKLDGMAVKYDVKDGGTILLVFNNFVTANSKKLAHGDVAPNWENDGLKIAERWWLA